MLRSFSLFFFSLAIVCSGRVILSAEPQSDRAGVVSFSVNMSREPLRILVQKGSFNGGVRVRAIPVESVKFGKKELWLIRSVKMPKGISEIIRELGAMGMEPAGYRELLEFAIQAPNVLNKGEVVYALGSPIALPSGTVSWQCYGLNSEGRRFLSDVVQGDGWLADSFYLAKRKPSK